MSTYTISEIAHRSGFTTSALRYYEGRGLLAPSARTEGGYRVYDDRTVSRLAFIARAKQLGCSLDEIIDLVVIWDGEHCGPVQRRFHDLVTTKIDAVQTQMAELTAFAAQLRRAAAQLSAPAVDGPCDEGCACLAEERTETTALTLIARPDRAPVACTLDTRAMPDRVAEWQAMLSRASPRERSEDGAVRVRFPSGVPLDELTRLVTAEQRCCAFFAFAITVDERGIGLEVRAPEGADDIITAMFGATRPRDSLESGVAGAG